jgi:hypothetical protein
MRLDSKSHAMRLHLGVRALSTAATRRCFGELGAFPRIGSIGTGPFTFETWLKTREPSVSVIAGYRDPGPEEVGFLFGLYVDRAFVQLRSVPNRRSATVVSDGRWHHVVVRRNEVGELTALVDFVPVSVEFPTALRDIDPSSAMLHIGADSAGSGATYTGQLRLTRIWGCERSDERIEADAETVFGPRDALLFELPLDETSSTVQETVGPTTLTVSSSTTRVMDCLPDP